jgi:hypothetical protein
MCHFVKAQEVPPDPEPFLRVLYGSAHTCFSGGSKDLNTWAGFVCQLIRTEPVAFAGDRVCERQVGLYRHV